MSLLENPLLWERDVVHDLEQEQFDPLSRRLAELIESVQGFVWETRGDGLSDEQTFTYLSDFCEQLSGYTAEEWRTIPRLWLRIVHPEDRLRRERAVGAPWRGFRSSQDRWIRKDGRVIWTETRMTAILDSAGHAIGHRGITIDITAQRALQETIGQLAGALTEDRVAEVVVEAGRQICGADDAVLVLLRPHTGEAEIVRSAGTARLLPENWTRFPLARSHTFVAVAENRRPLFIESLLEEAALYPDLIRANPVLGTIGCAVLPLFTDGDLHGLLAFGMHSRHEFSRDEKGLLVTLARQSAQALDRARLFRQTRQAERNQRFLSEAGAILASSLDYSETLAGIARLIVPSMADLCFIDLLDEKSGTASRAHSVASGPQSEATVAKSLTYRPRRDMLEWHPPSRACFLGQATFIPELDEHITSLIAPDEDRLRSIRSLDLGSLITVPLTARGRSLGALTFATTHGRPLLTRTDFELAEDLARRAALAVDNSRLYKEAREALRARDNFISIASHELKTPLTSMKIQTQATARRIARGDSAVLEPEAMLKMLEQSDQQLNRLARLVDDMLDLSRIQTGHLTVRRLPFDLSAVLLDLLDRFRAQFRDADCPLTVAVQPHVVGTWDAHRIEQVVSNLVTNALRYARGKPVFVTLARAGAQVRLVVSDRGPGIAPENHDRIFGRFERGISASEVSGLGLGLYISRQIVEAHGGRLTLASALGQGAEFTVELPRSEAPHVT